MRRYKVAIFILSLLVIIESVLLIHLWIRRAERISQLPVSVKGKIAIVIDDWGYNLDNLDILKQIKYPLTLSVLPNLRYSKILAEQLRKQEFEIILHLPMESYKRVRLEENTIMTSMDETTIVNIIDKDLANVGNVSGVSNHMGSKATEDTKTMGIIFKEIKKRRLYFLDNLVCPKSICFDLANRMHIGFAKRDVFLDNKKEPKYIKRQLNQLKKKAKIYGQAIGIGHNHQITLEVLKEIMPSIGEEGYRFVFVSELVQ